MRLYLDVDGVLAPMSPPGEVPDTWPDLTEGFLGRRLVVYSPRMLQRVAALGLEVVWCTTWGPQAEPAFGPSLGGRSRRSLDVAGAALRPAGPKASAIREDLRAQPAPFVWADDDAITAGAREHLDQLGLPMLAVVPDRRRGLDPTDLDAIERFVATVEHEVQGRSRADADDVGPGRG